MLTIQTKSNYLTRRIAIQAPICQTYAFDSNIFVEISRGKKWIRDQFFTSNVSICKYDSKEVLLQEKTIHPDTFNQTLNGWISYIKDQFYPISEIKSIYYSIDEKDVDIWILIPKRNLLLLRRLVELEMNILKTLSYGNSSLYFLEFHILYLDNAEENTIISSKAIRL